MMMISSHILRKSIVSTSNLQHSVALMAALPTQNSKLYSLPQYQIQTPHGKHLPPASQVEERSHILTLIFASQHGNMLDVARTSTAPQPSSPTILQPPAGPNHSMNKSASTSTNQRVVHSKNNISHPANVFTSAQCVMDQITLFNNVLS